jgi:hypothetical protein
MKLRPQSADQTALRSQALGVGLQNGRRSLERWSTGSGWVARCGAHEAGAQRLAAVWGERRLRSHPAGSTWNRAGVCVWRPGSCAGPIRSATSSERNRGGPQMSFDHLSWGSTQEAGYSSPRRVICAIHSLEVHSLLGGGLLELATEVSAVGPVRGGRPRERSQAAH